MLTTTVQFQNVQPSAAFQFYSPATGANAKTYMKVGDDEAWQIDAGAGNAPDHKTSIAANSLCVVQDVTLSFN